MNLLDECIAALLKSNSKCEILSIDTTKVVRKKFFDTFPFVSWGRINWETVNSKIVIKTLDEIPFILAKFKKAMKDPIYIIWGDASLPVVKCDLKDALVNIGEITPLGIYGTWLYNPTEGWVIEFYHNGDMVVGFVDRVADTKS